MFTREGGSIPVVSTFQEELGLPSVLFGVGLPDENAHAPNEKLDVANFHGGIISSAILYEEIAKTLTTRRNRGDAETAEKRFLRDLRVLSARSFLRTCTPNVSRNARGDVNAKRFFGVPKFAL